MLARDIMTKNVITVFPETLVTDVARLLLEKKISGVPVINTENELIGIVTEGDLIAKEKSVKGPLTLSVMGALIYLEDPHRMEVELKKIAGIRVRDMMTKSVITVTEDTTVGEIATLMIEKGINRVPVLRHRKLVGIVTRANIVRSLLER